MKKEKKKTKIVTVLYRHFVNLFSFLRLRDCREYVYSDGNNLHILSTIDTLQP